MGSGLGGGWVGGPGEQSWTRYLRQAVVFMRNRHLERMFDFNFSAGFFASVKKIILGWRLGTELLL